MKKPVVFLIALLFATAASAGPLTGLAIVKLDPVTATPKLQNSWSASVVTESLEQALASAKISIGESRIHVTVVVESFPVEPRYIGKLSMSVKGRLVVIDGEGSVLSVVPFSFQVKQPRALVTTRAAVQNLLWREAQDELYKELLLDLVWLQK